MSDAPPRVLITGTTGWIGGRLAAALVARGVRVLGLARRETEVAGVTSVTADISTGAGLEKLPDVGRIDCCVHLAAVAGWCTLEAGLEVNVQGTRRLFDALLPLGCTRFVVASSIAAVGTGRPHHAPRRLPMPDDHPYAGYPWPYALSKIQTEQLVQFIATRHEHESGAARPPLDVALLRIGCCITDPADGPPRHLETAIDDGWTAKPADGATKGDDMFPEGPLACIAVSDMVECLSLAALAPHRAGVRTMNVTAQHAFIADGCSVPQVMRTIYGDDALAHVDFSHYERAGHERDSLYDNSAVRRELGFEPKVNLLTDYAAGVAGDAS
eukprot:6267989-Prymnesium_polylepis.1